VLDRAAGRVLVLGVLVLVMVGLASGQQVAGVAGTDADNPDRVESFENDLGGWSKEGSSSSLAISRVSSGFNTPSAFDGDKFVEVDVTADETTSSGVQGIEKTIDLTKFDAIEVYVTSMFDNGPVKLWVDGNLQKEIQPTSFKGLEVDLTQFDGNHDIGIGTNIPSGQNRRSGIDFVRLYEGNTAPSIDSSSISPDPPLIGDALDVSASASDPDGSVQSLEVEIFQDGTSVFSSSTSSSSLDINDAYTVQEGTVDVKFTATDDAGATTTDTITRTVSDTAPASPTINKPTGNFNTPTTQYDVTVPSDGDDFPGESLTLTLKKDGSQVDQVTTSEGSTVTGSFQTSTEGSHNFDVVVEEPDGETSTASSNYNVDFVDPTVDSLSVSPSPLEYETASDVTVGASDNVEVQEVCVSVDKDGSTFVSQTCRQTASSTVSETFTDFFTPDETNSDYTVTTTVTDNQGETGTSTQTFTLSNDAPTASGSFNPSTFGFDDQIDVSYSFSDPNGNFDQGTITAFKDGSQVASTTVNSLSGTLTDFFTITETNSDYTVNLTATDLQGASNTFSETQTVLNQAPTLSDSYNPSTWTFNDNVEINFDFNDANGNIDTRSITVFKDW